MKTPSTKFFVRKTILRHMKNFARNFDGARKGDVEGIHQLRVASRRFRNALWAFSSLLDGKSVKKWRKEIGEAAKTCGEARDLDVEMSFLVRLKQRTKNPDEKAGIRKMLFILDLQRKQLQTDIVKAIEIFEKRETTRKVEKRLGRMSEGAPERQTIDLFNLAQSKIAKRLKRMLKYDKYAACPEKTAKIHALRIAAKWLRYTLECFQLLYGDKMNKHIEHARSIQNVLGLFHDYDVWLTSSSEFPGRKKRDEQIARGSDCFIKECAAMKNRAYKQFAKVWHRLKHEKQWRSLIQLITSKND